MLYNLFARHPHWPAVEKIARVLSERGHRVVLAGGCVRDALLGLIAQDLDIATDATPEQVGSAFEKVLHIGKSFGVCRVVEDGASIEVATFREESDYRDGRHPDTVVYSSLEADAHRRDFTVNAMYFDLASRKVIDLVGGERDLKAHKLVTVGDPHRRFGEDLLRVLRGARFAAQLDFALDPAAQAAMAKLAPELHKISRERIHDEFHKAFKSQKPALFFEISQRTGVLAALIPDLHWEAELGFLGQRKNTGEVLEKFFSSPVPSPALGWAMLLWARVASGAEKTAGHEWLKSFKLPLAMIAEAVAVADGVRFFEKGSDQLGIFIDLARQNWCESFDIFWRRLAAILGERDILVAWDDLRRRHLKNGTLPAPLITGQDLLDAGVKQGPEFKKKLDRAFRLQLTAPSKTKSEILKEI